MTLIWNWLTAEHEVFEWPNWLVALNLGAMGIVVILVALIHFGIIPN